MKLVISDPESHPIYFGFELRFSEYFNKAYFESLCSEDPSSAFILKYVDNTCPQSMSLSQCALSEIKKEQCDTTCHAVKDKDDASDAEWLNCCPSEEECDNGNLAGCPFHRSVHQMPNSYCHNFYFYNVLIFEAICFQFQVPSGNTQKFLQVGEVSRCREKIGSLFVN